MLTTSCFHLITCTIQLLGISNWVLFTRPTWNVNVTRRKIDMVMADRFRVFRCYFCFPAVSSHPTVVIFFLFSLFLVIYIDIFIYIYIRAYIIALTPLIRSKLLQACSTQEQSICRETVLNRLRVNANQIRARRSYVDQVFNNRTGLARVK